MHHAWTHGCNGPHCCFRSSDLRSSTKCAFQLTLKLDLDFKNKIGHIRSTSSPLSPDLTLYQILALPFPEHAYHLNHLTPFVNAFFLYLFSHVLHQNHLFPHFEVFPLRKRLYLFIAFLLLQLDSLFFSFFLFFLLLVFFDEKPLKFLFVIKKSFLSVMFHYVRCFIKF